MAQQLRTLAALLEGSRSNSQHLHGISQVNFSARRYTALSWPLQLPSTQYGPHGYKNQTSKISIPYWI